MNRFAYRVYYEYNGPSHSDPFRSPKNSDEISEALKHFPNELSHHLPDQDATVSYEPTKGDSNSIKVTIETVLNEAKTDEAVRRCLKGLDLFGTKLEQG
ncbi:MAG: hypothetical protein KKH74_15095 [Gammaproteobacteria bacterium]|nr:hypothetical protein [Gammaproteobacteria bacterium]